MPESTNSAGESQASDLGGESRKPTESELEQVASLLRGDDDQDNNDDGDGGESGQRSGDDGSGDESEDGKPGESHESEPPKTLNEIAKRLGIEVKDLYGIELEMSAGDDGESRTKTLGDMKDLASDHGQFEVDQLQFEETKVKRESEFLKAQTELADIIQMLPKSAIKPELIQVLADKREQTLTREKGLTLKAIPDWKDDSVEGADRKSMQAHLAEYGYTSNYLDSITDHRTLKYIRDNMQRQERITRALAQVKKVKKPGHRPSDKPNKAAPARMAGKRARNVESEVAQVAELLKTG